MKACQKWIATFPYATSTCEPIRIPKNHQATTLAFPLPMIGTYRTRFLAHTMSPTYSCSCCGRMYLGFEEAAINREITTVLQAAYRIRTRKMAKTLAIGETAVFALAEAAISTGRLSSSSLLQTVKPSRKAVARGILSALTFLVDRDMGFGHDGGSHHHHQESCTPVDADLDPESRSVDPYGNDYFASCVTMSWRTFIFTARVAVANGLQHSLLLFSRWPILLQCGYEAVRDQSKRLP
jgi:hypothetical protein